MPQGKASKRNHRVPSVVTYAGRQYTGKQWRTLRYRVAFKKTGGRCALCCEFVEPNDESSPLFGTVDHIVPVSRGGHDQPANWQLTCRACNVAKSNSGEWDEIAAQLHAHLRTGAR